MILAALLVLGIAVAAKAQPIITAQPASLSRNAGEFGVLSVTATGTSPLQYQWFKGTALLTDDGNISGSTNATLTVSNLLRADAGEYFVVIANTYGAVTSSLAILTVNLTSVDAFNPQFNGDATALAVQTDGKIVAGGWFTQIGGKSRTYLGRLNTDGTVDESVTLGASSPVASIAVQPDGKILLGGYFNRLGGQIRQYVGRLNVNGTLDTAFDPDADTWVYSLGLQADAKVLVGGRFISLGGEYRNYIGRLNSDGTVDSQFNPVASGEVYSIALQEDGKILVGGGFTTLGGQERKYLGRLNSDGTLDDAFHPKAIGWVFCLALQADGKILVGGAFTNLAGQSRSYLGRLNADGTLDTAFNPGASGYVYSFALQADGKILVGGAFTNLAGQGRRYLGRLNVDGAIDTTFDPTANSVVKSLALQPDGKLLVGGTFTNLAGQGRKYLGRLENTDSALESLSFDGSSLTWMRGGAAPEFSRATVEVWNGGSWISPGSLARIAGGWQVAGMSLDTNSTIRVRGYFTGGMYNSSTSFEEAFSGPLVVTAQPLGLTNNARTMAVFSVTAAGPGPLQYQWFKGGIPLSEGGRVTGATNSTLTLSNVLGADAGAYSVVISNSVEVLTSTVANLSVVDPVITAQPANQSVNAGQTATFTVSAVGTDPLEYQWSRDGMALSGATNASLVLSNMDGGDADSTYRVVVSSAYGSVTSIVAVLTVNLSLADSFDPGANGLVLLAVPMPDGKVLVGGTLTNLAGQDRGYLGCLNADGTLNTTFNPGANSHIYSLALQADGKILVGGAFTNLAGQSRSYLGRLNADGTLDTAFNPGASGYVYSFALQADRKILVGGAFTNLAGQSRRCLGRLNADGTLDATFNPGANNHVYSFAVQADGRILVGGAFTALGGQSRSCLGRLNANGTLDSMFNSWASSTINSVALQADGKILVGGEFTILGGQSRSGLGRLNADGTLDPVFNPGANNSIYSFALQADGRILVGGAFTALGGQSRSRIGRLNADGTLDTTFNPEADSLVYSLALQADGKILVGGGFTNLAGQKRTSIGRLENTAPPIHSIGFAGTSLTWMRDGTAPEFSRATLDTWQAGAWTNFGGLTRIAGGWQINGLTLSAQSTIRVRGYICGAYHNGSSSIEEALSGGSLITTQPASRTNNEGTVAYFSVTAVSGTPMEYQWFKSAVPLTDGGAVIGSTSTTLIVSNVLAADAGAYSVVITNAFGNVTSDVAVLTVLLPPRQFTAQTVDGGISIEFSGTPNYAYILQSANALVPPVNWEPVLTNVTDGDGNWSHTVTNILAAPIRFYRAIGQ